MSSEVSTESEETQHETTDAGRRTIETGLRHGLNRQVPGLIVLLLLLFSFSLALKSSIDDEYAQNVYSIPVKFERQDISMTLVLTHPQYIHLESGLETYWLLSAQMIPYPGLSMTSSISYVVHFSSEKDRLVFKDEEGHIVQGQLALTPFEPQTKTGTLLLEPRPVKDDVLGKTTIFITVVDSTQQSRFVGTTEIDIETPQAFWMRRLLSKLLGELSISASLILALAGWMIESRNRLKAQQEKERTEAFNDVRKAIEEDAIQGVKEFNLFLSDTRYGITEDMRNGCKRKIVTPQFIERLVRRVNQQLLERSSFEDDAALLQALSQCQPEQESALTDLKTVIDSAAQSSEVLQKARCIWKQYDPDAREIVVRAFQRIGEQELAQVDDWESKELELFQDERLKNIHIKTPPVFPDLQLSILKRKQLPLDRTLSNWLAHQGLRFNPFDLGVWTPEPLPNEQQELRPFLKSSWTPPNDWDTIVDAEPIVCAASSSDAAAAADDRTAASVMASDSLLEQGQSFVVFWQPSSERLGTDDETSLRAVLHVFDVEWLRLLARYPQTFVQIADYEQVALTELLIWITGSFRQLEGRLRQEGLDRRNDSRVLLQRLQELSRPITHGWVPGYERLITWLLVRPVFVSRTFLVVDTVNYVQAGDLAPMMDILYDRGVTLKLFCDARTVNPSHYGTRVQLSWDDNALKSALSARMREASRQRFDEFDWLFADRSLDIDDRLVQHAQGSLGRLLQLGNAILAARLRRSSDPQEGLTDEDVKAGLV